MAIVVESLTSHQNQVLEANDPTWVARVEQSHKFGHPLHEAIPTVYPKDISRLYPFNSDVKRSFRDGVILYTLPGLLHTLFSFFELDTDHVQGISKLSDIASPSLELQQFSHPTKFTKQLESAGSITIPDYIYRRRAKALLNDGIMHDVTTQIINLSSRTHATSTHREISGLKQVVGTLRIYPHLNGIPQNRVELASLKLQAFNLPGMGDDLDDVTAMAVWGN